MSNDQIFSDMIDKIIDFVQLLNLDTGGSIGEIVAQLLLLKAFDNSQKLLDSEACTVRSFLTTLFGDFSDQISKIPTKTLNGIVYFNHFIQRLEDFTYDDVLPSYIARGAAGQFKKNFETFDLFIPIVLEKSDITYILIQVKNKENLSSKSIEIIFEKMRSQGDQFFRNQTKIDHILLLMSLGDKCPRLPKLLPGQLFYSLRDIGLSRIYNEYTMNRLIMILNCVRLNLKSNVYDQEVIKLVTVGSLK